MLDACLLIPRMLAYKAHSTHSIHLLDRRLRQGSMTHLSLDNDGEGKQALLGE